MAEPERKRSRHDDEARPQPEITPMGVELSERAPAPPPHWPYAEFERPQPNTQRQEPGISAHALQASFLPHNEAVIQREQDEPDGEPASEDERHVRLMRTNQQYAQTQHERRLGVEDADPDTLSPEQELAGPSRHGASRGEDRPFSQTENR